MLAKKTYKSHFFTVTETLNSDEYMTSLPLWVRRRHIGPAVQHVKICRSEKNFYVQLNNVVLNFTEF